MASTTPLPVSRSNAVTVQVNGGDLFEALSFVRKTLNRRVVAAALQLATLLGQVTSLIKPRKDASPKSAPANQEAALAELIFETIMLVCSKSDAPRRKMEESIAEGEGKLAKLEKEKKEKEDEAANGGENEHIATQPDGGVNPTSTTAWAKAMKSSLASVSKSLSQTQRDYASLNAAVFSILDEVTRSTFLCHSLGRERVVRIFRLKALYCPYAERFFDTSKELAEFVSSDASIALENVMHVIEAPMKVVTTRLDSGDERIRKVSTDIETLAWSTLIPGDAFYTSREKLIWRIQSMIDADLCNNPKSAWPKGAKLRAFGSSANNFEASSRILT